MRPSALLLLLLLPICGAAKNNTIEGEPCFAVPGSSQNDEAKGRLYEALNGECSEKKGFINACCSTMSACVAGGEWAAKCGLAQARCIGKVVNDDEDVCQRRTAELVRHGLNGGEVGKDFALVPRLGITRALYDACTDATAKIDECAGKLKDCVDRHGKRPKTEGGARKPVVLEPYECSNNGGNCLGDADDIDHSLKCSFELGNAMGVMKRRWRAIVDGKEEWSEKEEEGDEDGGALSSVDPFTVLIDGMHEQLGISWWAAFAIFAGMVLVTMTGCLMLCFCCAMVGMKRQRQRRRLQRRREMKERGTDRYSTVEAVQPSSVRVSRYSVEETEGED